MLESVLLVVTLLVSPDQIQVRSVASTVTAPPQFSWMVAFDHLRSDFKRSLIGTLELDDTRLKFRSSTDFASWEIALPDLVSVRESLEYGRGARAVMIESADGLTRYVAVLDERDLMFEKPTKVLEVMRKKGLSPFNAQRLAASAERIRR